MLLSVAMLWLMALILGQRSAVRKVTPVSGCRVTVHVLVALAVKLLMLPAASIKLYMTGILIVYTLLLALILAGMMVPRRVTMELEVGVV